jgi:RNA polymerase sigma-70 factor (ECF subfamily)
MSDSRATAASISDLLSRAQSGDQGAENALFEQLHARTLSLAKRRIGDEQAAQDIAQETIKTALEKYLSADLSRGMLPWVFTILRNKVGNYLKKRRTEAAHLAHPPAPLEWSAVGAVVDETGSIDLIESLEKALGRASEECRRIFQLLLADAPREEICRAFGGEPIGTTYSRISRCRDKLLRELESLWRERSR